MATQILRTGGAVTVEIPEEMLRQANLAVGDPVEWTLTENGSLALLPPHNIDELLSPEEGYEVWKAQEIEAGFAEIDSGHFVDGEKVREWVKSWGKEQELPRP